MAFVYAVVVALFVVGNDVGAAMLVVESGPTVGDVLTLLPPWYVLLLVGVVVLVSVPITSVTMGLRRDLRSSRSRRRRLE